ncbi:MAG: hypothetical protein A2096_02315 [Spirochaetes bacterium GWF1_41_5]|nr:MAG: hypothetical protein A2096_02315 [Spirochaetes bacterium GWF1_41_5]
MKIIDRYILREIIPPFIVGTAFFTFVMVINKFVADLIRLYFEKNIDFLVVMRLFIYMLPFTMALTVPMGVIFGILIGFGRMAHDTEITALQASGISMLRIYLPALALGLCLSVLMILFNNYILPETNHRYKTLYRNVIFSNPGILLADRTFTSIPDTRQQVTALHYNDAEQKMDDVFIYEFSGEQLKVTWARKGAWINNYVNSPLIILRLTDSIILEIDMKDLSRYQPTICENIDIKIKTRISQEESLPRSLREISAWEIAKKIQEELKQNIKSKPFMYVEYHKRFSIPFACLVFVVIGSPLAVSARRSGKGIGMGFSIIIIFSYYIFMFLGETNASSGRMPAALGMWLPNIVLLAAGSIFFVRSVRQ